MTDTTKEWLGKLEILWPAQIQEASKEILERIVQVEQQEDCTHSAEDIIRLLAAGKAQLWAAEHANGEVSICITEVIQEPKLRYLLVWDMAGSGVQIFSNLSKLYSDLQTIARAVGCQEIRSNVTKPTLVKMYERRTNLRPAGVWMRGLVEALPDQDTKAKTG